MTVQQLENAIQSIADFPQSGVVFKDITPVLSSYSLFNEAIEQMCKPHLHANINKIIGIETRGFFFATGMALRLGCGFVPIRKAGKLPRDTIQQRYQLEYGENILEMHRDSLNETDRIIIVDDVLATSGTAKAGILLVEALKATIVSVDFFLELTTLNGRAQLANHTVHSLIEQ